MGLRNREYLDISPHQEQMNENLYEVLPILHQENNQGAPDLTFEDFKDVSELERSRDKEWLREQESKKSSEKHELGVFFEAALPQAGYYGWLGDVEFVNFKKNSAIDRYNDRKGTDFMIELPPDKKGGKSSVLRIDATTGSDVDRLSQKVAGQAEVELGNGKFGGVYFKTNFPGKGRPEKEKINSAPRVVMYLDYGQITELGLQLVAHKVKGDKEARKSLEESSLQLTLIEQARRQLESQAILALAMFTEKVEKYGRNKKLPAEQVEAVQGLFERLSQAVEAKDSSKALELVNEFLNSEHLKNLPRSIETKKILEGLTPWLDHFSKLEQEKKDSLPEQASKKALIEAEVSRPHQVLTDFPSEARSHLPRGLQLV